MSDVSSFLRICNIQSPRLQRLTERHLHRPNGIEVLDFAPGSPWLAFTMYRHIGIYSEVALQLVTCSRSPLTLSMSPSQAPIRRKTLCSFLANAAASSGDLLGQFKTRYDAPHIWFSDNFHEPDASTVHVDSEMSVSSRSE